MRLILVHGINQQEKSAALIKDEWLSALDKTFSKRGPNPLGAFSRIDAAFYGRTLADLAGAPATAVAVAQGVNETPDDFDIFARAALEEIGLRMGASAADYAEELGETIVPQGAGPHKKWLKAVARVLERLSPPMASLAMRLLVQAHAYIKRPHIAQEVDELVRPLFVEDEPAVVIAHSLGTIVSYKLLREFAEKGKPRSCPLFLTLGSPLGIDSVRQGFPKPRSVPGNIARWLNGADPEDFVALRPSLTAATFGPGIENISDIENGHDDPHAIAGYLSDPRIAAAIRDAVA